MNMLDSLRAAFAFLYDPISIEDFNIQIPGFHPGLLSSGPLNWFQSAHRESWKVI